MMKNLLLLLFVCTMLCGCMSAMTSISTGIFASPQGLQTAFIRKDYKPVGRVRVEHSRTCIFFNLLCTKPYFVHDDLIAQANKMGANEVIDVIIDKHKTPMLWSILYSHEQVKANGLAVLLSPEDLSREKTMKKK